jgi:hypothetical protein
MKDDDELGRRVLAALMSYQLGNKSIDYTMKKYVNGPIAPSWERVGRELLRNMVEGVASVILKGPSIFTARNAHVDVFPVPMLGLEESEGFKSYFENHLGEQWVAVAEIDRFRVTGGDIGWNVLEVLNPDYASPEKIFAGLNLVVNQAERLWLVAVIETGRTAYTSLTTPVTATH